MLNSLSQSPVSLSLVPPILDTRDLAWAIATAADERKAGDITLLNVAEVSYLADYFVIATGYSTTQVRAITDSIESALVEQFGLAPVRLEGKGEGSWVVMDYSDVIVHIQLPEEREFYNLEAFWGHAERLPFDPGANPA